MTSTHPFTTEALDWRSYVHPVILADATDAQHAAMKTTPSNMKVSDYILTLAHDPQVLAVRTPLYNAVMYGRGGLGRPLRELGALVASVLNRCVFCASTHAARFVQLTGRRDVVEAIFTDGADAKLEPEWQPVFAFAVKLTREPGAVGAHDHERLREAGLSDLQILDLVLSVSMFAWANRLMHTLGEAEYPVTNPEGG